MANTFEYSDIDAFLVNNIKNDFSIIEGIAYCVKNCIYNNLLISSKEIPFDNSFKPDITDVIHNDQLFTRNMQIQDAVEYAALQDNRIKEIVSIKVSNSDDFTTEIKLEVKMINDPNDIVGFKFSVNRD